MRGTIRESAKSLTLWKIIVDLTFIYPGIRLEGDYFAKLRPGGVNIRGFSCEYWGVDKADDSRLCPDYFVFVTHG